MNRRQAVQVLHDRHPKVVHPPHGPIDLGELHLEVFWLQGHVCDLLDRRAAGAARRCFETVQRLLVEGDDEVRDAVPHHFLIPHLVFHEDLKWARERMPPLLAELCEQIRAEVTGGEPGGPPSDANR